MDHDQKFHKTIVDVARRCGLDDEDVLVSYGLAYSDTGLLVGVVQAHGLCDLYAQPAPALEIRICAIDVVGMFLTGARGVTDRFATSWANKGWEFPLSSLISFDMVDMVKEVLDVDALERNAYPADGVWHRRSRLIWDFSVGLSYDRACLVGRVGCGGLWRGAFSRGCQRRTRCFGWWRLRRAGCRVFRRPGGIPDGWSSSRRSLESRQEGRTEQRRIWVGKQVRIKKFGG